MRHLFAVVLIASQSTLLFHLHDQRLDEVSGIAAGIRSPGVVYVQNDSGDSARFFALDAEDGDVLAEYDVPDVTAVDWEDIAVAPDARGVASVWLADIGDNGRDRSQIELYRVPEPRVDVHRHDAVIPTARPQVWRLGYPSGPADAESLAVSPAGRPYVITKSFDGVSAVFAAPRTPGRATLRRVGTIRFTPTGTPGPGGVFGELLATGADLSRDGSRLVVRTYTDAYVWTVHGGDVRAALRGHPVRIALPRQPQGEGICFDRGALLIDSEHRGSAVYQVALPPAHAVPSPSHQASTHLSAAPSTPASVPATSAAPSHSSAVPGIVGAVVLAAAALVGAGAWRGRRRGKAGSST